jgi:hypothetical protein
MTVVEMIQNLQQFPPDQEVQITAGFQHKFYFFFFEFQLLQLVSLLNMWRGGQNET